MPERIACATQAHCPASQQCCLLTGTCVDPACSDCCRPPPAGTDFPCRTDNECNPGQYCRGEGCGTPGGCAAITGPGRCSGEIDAVCGCNGRSYVNACWATGVGVRVASRGQCPMS